MNKPVKYQSSQLADVLETYRQRLVRESQNEAIQNRLRDFIKSKGLPEEKTNNEVIKEVQQEEKLPASVKVPNVSGITICETA